MHGSIRPIGVCNVAQLRCDEVGTVGLGIKIKDSVGFKWRWIVSMVVANASTPGRSHYAYIVSKHQDENRRVGIRNFMEEL